MPKITNFKGGRLIVMRIIYTKKAPEAIGPYSQGIISSTNLFTSGQIPVDPETGTVVGGGIAAQAEQSIQNVKAILEEAGTSLDKVVKTTCFLATMDDFTEFNKIYERHFVSKPARSCVAVRTLPKNVLCEIEVVAEI